MRLWRNDVLLCLLSLLSFRVVSGEKVESGTSSLNDVNEEKEIKDENEDDDDYKKDPQVLANKLVESVQATAETNGVLLCDLLDALLPQLQNAMDANSCTRSELPPGTPVSQRQLPNDETGEVKVKFSNRHLDRDVSLGRLKVKKMDNKLRDPRDKGKEKCDPIDKAKGRITRRYGMDYSPGMLPPLQQGVPLGPGAAMPPPGVPLGPGAAMPPPGYPMQPGPFGMVPGGGYPMQLSPYGMAPGGGVPQPYYQGVPQPYYQEVPQPYYQGAYPVPPQNNLGVPQPYYQGVPQPYYQGAYLVPPQNNLGVPQPYYQGAYLVPPQNNLEYPPGYLGAPRPEGSDNVDIDKYGTPISKMQLPNGQKDTFDNYVDPEPRKYYKLRMGKPAKIVIKPELNDPGIGKGDKTKPVEEVKCEQQDKDFITKKVVDIGGETQPQEKN